MKDKNHLPVAFENDNAVYGHFVQVPIGLRAEANGFGSQQTQTETLELGRAVFSHYVD